MKGDETGVCVAWEIQGEMFDALTRCELDSVGEVSDPKPLHCRIAFCTTLTPFIIDAAFISVSKYGDV